MTTLNPLSKDLVWTGQGISELFKAAVDLIYVWNGKGGKTGLNAMMEAGLKVLDLMGLPAGNLKRDIVGIFNSALLGAGRNEEIYRMDKLMLDIRDDTNKPVFFDTLYRAMWGDTLQYQFIYGDMLKHGFTPEEINKAMTRRMANVAGLKRVSSMPKEWEWSAPGEDREFDRKVQKARENGKDWKGMTEDEVWETAMALDKMESGSSAIEKMRKVADMPVGDHVKDDAMAGFLSDSAYARYTAARDAGMSAYEYVNALEAIQAATVKRKGEDGSPNQEDVIKALERSRLTDTKKRAIWKGYGWKSTSPWG